MNSVEGAGLTCIVLHGAGGNASLVAPILAALSQRGVRGIAPDLPGYGWSSVPSEAFRYPAWVESVGELARRERERGPVALFGLSMGGMLAFHVAAAQPGLISGVAATNLLDISDDAVKRAVVRRAWMAPLTSLMLPAFDSLRLPIRWLANMRAIANDPELANACASDPRGGGLRVPLGFLRSWLDFEPALAPERSSVPVLLAHPGDDRWTPKQASMPFFDRLAGPRRLVDLPNCGHAPVEEPGIGILRSELADFLGRLERGESLTGDWANAPSAADA